MESAFGNFNAFGERVIDEDAIMAKVNYHASKIVAIEDELKRLQFVYNNAPVESVAGTLATEKYPSMVTLDVLNYISKEDLEAFSSLFISMLANGATLQELQQRLMGLG